MSIQHRCIHLFKSASAVMLLLLLLNLAQAAPPPTILVLGDSLSAAYRIPPQEGWVSLLQQQLRNNGYPHQVINLSISGETSQGGLSQLPQALARHQPQFLILALGSNDGLRGSSLKQLRQNLSTMVDLAKAEQVKVLLVGMELPPNYGEAYNQKFRNSFKQVAEQQQVALVPFLLQKMALQRELFQEDNLHPVAAAQPLLLETVWSGLKPLLH